MKRLGSEPRSCHRPGKYCKHTATKADMSVTKLKKIESKLDKVINLTCTDHNHHHHHHPHHHDSTDCSLLSSHPDSMQNINKYSY